MDKWRGLANGLPFHYRRGVEVLEEGAVVRFKPREHRCGQRLVDLRFAVVDESLECVGVSVQPLPGGDLRPITAARLRECLAVGELIEKAKRKLAREGRFPELRVDRDELRQLTDRLVGTRQRHGPDHFALVAEVYATAAATGHRPTQAIADRFRVPHSTAAKWVARARELELLTRTSQGKAGGRLHHAEALLRGSSSLTAEGEVYKPKRSRRRPPKTGGK